MKIVTIKSHNGTEWYKGMIGISILVEENTVIKNGNEKYQTLGNEHHFIDPKHCTVLSDAVIINHKAETSSKEILEKSSGPVLIAKAGEWVKIIDFGSSKPCDDWHLNTPYQLIEDLTEKNGFYVVKDCSGYRGNGWSHAFKNGMKFEKCYAPVGEVKEESIKNPIDKVTIELLDMVLRMCNIQLSHALIDKIIDVVELIEEKGEETSLMDVCKMQAEWKRI